jgi:hypothetical protein
MIFMDKAVNKIEKYINEIEFGKVIVTIHEGKVMYIEKQKKEKLE